MNIDQIKTECFILALFIREDGERILLGSGEYEFKESQLHFSADSYANDVVEVQGNDGVFLAGQVRRPTSQVFDGYVGDATVQKTKIEEYRRNFLAFFRKNYYYTVVYIFPDGTAIQRRKGFIVDAPEVKELYQVHPEYHIALNFEDVNYYSYSEDESGQEIYTKNAIIYLSTGGVTGGLVWDSVGAVNLPYTWTDPVEFSGSDLTIDNELDIMVPLKDLELRGDTFQQTYSGKNLWSFNTGSFTNNSSTNLTATYTDNDLDLTANGTTGAQYVSWFTPELDNTKTYIVSGKAKKIVKGTDGQPILRITVSHSEDGTNWSAATGLYINSNPVQGQEYSFSNTLESGHKYYRFRLYNNTNTPVTIGEETTYYDLQLEVGSTATSYEPYTGSTPSQIVPAPNPDYPQDVQTVTGEQTVNITGKNLFNVDGPSGVYRATKTINGQSLTATATANGVGYVSVVLSNSDKLLGKSCTISFTAQASVGSGRVRVYQCKSSTPESVGNAIVTKDGNGYQTLSFTFPNSFDSGRDAFAILFFIQSGGSITIGDSGTYSNIQLETGSSATAYEPYYSQSYTVDLGSIELCKIGDYQDYIYKSGDDWYVHKDCGKVVLDGNESWNKVNGAAYNTYYVSNLITALRTDSTNPYLSTYFTPISYNERYKDLTFIINSQNQILMSYNSITTISDFQTWLSSHNISVYYALATPTDTKITDETLLNQLNAIGAMKLFVGQNNISVQSAGSNLPVLLKASYATGLDTAGAGFEWEEGGSGGPTTVMVDSIDRVYPVWRLTGPAVNPQLAVLETGTTLSYTGTITASQTLEIDMFNKTAKLNGTSVIGNVSGDWVYFRPGNNRVAYTTNNADALPSMIYWQEVVG